ncbi:hypothetical protein BDY21DRAFT_345079 [Lineolata rhizophorae]|uniref:Uncharacterized protein n=1 Tax=Lineolata rhizophorae TaxID=578093 RepID=A0A6A6NZK0_9PEZI|nr:hypothetical protein BDY21DRAFT_345079 [Lineolata rhizophorae]
MCGRPPTVLALESTRSARIIAGNDGVVGVSDVLRSMLVPAAALLPFWPSAGVLASPLSPPSPPAAGVSGVGVVVMEMRRPSRSSAIVDTLLFGLLLLLGGQFFTVAAEGWLGVGVGQSSWAAAVDEGGVVVVVVIASPISACCCEARIRAVMALRVLSNFSRSAFNCAKSSSTLLVMATSFPRLQHYTDSLRHYGNAERSTITWRVDVTGDIAGDVDHANVGVVEHTKKRKVGQSSRENPLNQKAYTLNEYLLGRRCGGNKQAPQRRMQDRHDRGEGKEGGEKKAARLRVRYAGRSLRCALAPACEADHRFLQHRRPAELVHVFSASSEAPWCIGGAAAWAALGPLGPRLQVAGESAGRAVAKRASPRAELMRRDGLTGVSLRPHNEDLSLSQSSRCWRGLIGHRDRGLTLILQR